DDVVGGPQRRDRSHAHRLLPDSQVEEAADLALRVRLRGRLLDAPDEQHLAIELEQEHALALEGLLVAWFVHGGGDYRQRRPEEKARTRGRGRGRSRSRGRSSSEVSSTRESLISRKHAAAGGGRR